jgi:hypothetical protein
MFVITQTLFFIIVPIRAHKTRRTKRKWNKGSTQDKFARAHKTTETKKREKKRENVKFVCLFFSWWNKLTYKEENKRKVSVRIFLECS